MKVAVLGTGSVGQTIAGKLAQLGHEVTIGTRNVEESLARKGKDRMGQPSFGEWHQGNSNIKVKPFAEAAKGAELIVNATSGSGAMPALEAAGKDNLSGKVVLDISNPLDFSKGMPPTLTVCNTDSLGEQIQRAFPQAKIVKGLNTLNAFLMVNPSALKEEHHLFICGNDSDAKEKIKDLLVAFGWKKENIIDLGDITNARGTEQLLPIWIRLMVTLQTPMFNFRIVK
jgi:predicted dinucleotide-binding enzyme